jgi:signal peptidase I
VPRANIVGRPLFNYWSFKTPERQYEETSVVSKVSWLGHVVVHFFTETRWDRTLKLMR